MRIATRLWISAAATGAALVSIVPVIFWTYAADRDAAKNEELAKSIQSNFFGRAAYRDQYFLYREDRLRILWDESKAQSDSLLRLAKYQFRDEADQRAVEQVRRTIEDTSHVFHRVVESTRALKSATVNREVWEELDKRLYSQLLLKAADVRNAIEALQESSARQVKQTRQRLIEVSGALALLLGFIIVINAVQIGALIRRRLAPLHEGANRIANGEIAHRIASEGTDEFSEIAGAINLMMDTLTQRQKTIKQAADYSRSLLEASVDPFVTISADGKITDVNEASVKATGVAREALIGTDFACYFTDPDRAREGYQRVFSKSFVTDYPLAIRSISGRITDVLYNASVYRDEEGMVLGVFAAARDVTERMKAEEALRIAEQRLDLALQYAEVGVWDLDLIHDTAWRTLRHDMIFGYASAPAQWGREIAMRHLVPEDRGGFAHAFEVAFGSGQFFLECRVIHPDQTTHWIQAQGKVIAYVAGRPARMLGTVVDITKQRESKDALEALSGALERSNMELEQFAYVASHDLQEPLRMVVSYVQLLERRLADKLDADTREFMAYAVDGATRMQGMIEDILTYSRVTSKAQPLAPVDSAAALQEALDRLTSSIKKSCAEVDVQPLPSVMADRSQLVQLFQNLISNAIKFCKDRAPRVRVQAVHEPGRWRFSVSDNGIGIAPEYRDQLFVIFRRLHTQREYPGTGIGLAICKRIIERHGGEIGVDSAPGGGAVFWFTIPEEHGP